VDDTTLLDGRRQGQFADGKRIDELGSFKRARHHRGPRGQGRMSFPIQFLTAEVRTGHARTGTSARLSFGAACRGVNDGKITGALFPGDHDCERGL